MFRKGDVLVIYGLTSDIKEAFINSLDNSEKTIVVDQTNELNVLNNYGSNALMEIDIEEVPTELNGMPMKDANLGSRYSINIVILKRKGEYMFVDKDTILQKDDVITVFGPYKAIKRLFGNAE